MSNQLHKLQEVKQPRCLTHDEIRIHKTKRNMLVFMEYLGYVVLPNIRNQLTVPFIQRIRTWISQFKRGKKLQRRWIDQVIITFHY